MSKDNQLDDNSNTQHLFGDGRLSYIQIPARDAFQSANFYQKVFGWNPRDDGTADHVGFADATGDMIGAWNTDLGVAAEPGVLPFIYVHGIDAALERIRANGGAVVKDPYPEGQLWVATFRDPAGNVLGVWQQGPR